MKANELKLWNWVLCNGLRTIVNESLMISIINKDVLFTVEPVPLTEEWLLKFGFFMDEKFDTHKHPHKTTMYSKYELDCKYSFAYADFRGDWGFYHSYTDALDEKDDNKFDFISCGIKYVHQLQNLYFALTNKELKTKQ